MNDFQKQLRDKAAQQEIQRKQARLKESEARLRDKDSEINRQAAELIGAAPELVDSCCGSICPSCDMFLDKAVALVEIGSEHHLFMNPGQEEVFEEAREVFSQDRKEYERRREEFMDRMR